MTSYRSPITGLFDTRWNEETMKFTDKPNDAATYRYELSVLHADILGVTEVKLSEPDPNWLRVAFDICHHVRWARSLLPWYIEQVKDEKGKVDSAIAMILLLERKCVEMMPETDEQENKAP